MPPSSDEKRLNLALRIVQSTLAVEREKDAGIKALVSQGLAADKAAFGEAPQAPAVHRKQAATFLGMADKQATRSQEQALLLYRNAAAEALWGDDWETAVLAYRGWQRMRVRSDDI